MLNAVSNILYLNREDVLYTFNILFPIYLSQRVHERTTVDRKATTNAMKKIHKFFSANIKY